tara:strand:+ start:1878 stop:2120 length:243 start_codon:yes stop_codon:yes gene_type:complete
MKKSVEKDLKNIFFKHFSKKILKKTKFIDLDINNVAQWDSLKNLNLLLDVEKQFKFKMSLEEMSEVRSIKSIIKIIKKNV